MKTIIILLFFVAFIAVVGSKPTEDNDELISELKAILEERYGERKSLREVGGTDGSSAGGTGGTDGTDGTSAGEAAAIKTAKEKEEDIMEKEEEENAKEEQQEEAEIEKEEEEELEEEDSNGGSEKDKPGVKDMLEKGWDMLNELQSVSVALNLENNPIKDNKSPKEALHDVLTQMFQFDGLAQRVIRELLHRLSPEGDVCSQMFSDGEERTLERVTNCFIMRFTQLLSLIEHVQKATSAKDLHAEDLVRLTTLERDLLAASYEVFKIIKKDDPTVSLSDFMSGKLSRLLLMQGENTNPSESETSETSGGSESNPGEGASAAGGAGSDPEKPAGDAGNTEGQEGSSTSKRILKKDLLDRLTTKLKELLDGKP